MPRLAALAAVLALSACERPSASPVGKARVAAVAVRDEVPAYQQWGSEGFTVPFLKSGYDKHWYLTETALTVKGEALREALDEATREYDQVDLFILTHGNHFRANRRTHGYLTSSAAETILEVTERLGGPRISPAQLWAGTEAQLFGDAGLSQRPAAAAP